MTCLFDPEVPDRGLASPEDSVLGLLASLLSDPFLGGSIGKPSGPWAECECVVVVVTVAVAVVCGAGTIPACVVAAPGAGRITRRRLEGSDITTARGAFVAQSLAISSV